MLKNLYIENIAVIEKTSIDFSNGLNILTGETGAGKSIVIDSINAILGNRTSRDLIRNGSETAFVSAEFTELSQQALDVLNEYGFKADDDGSVLIQREITLSGKGKCRINGRPTTAGILKLIGASLINIHGQHESYDLMSPELHITYIDKVGGLEGELDDYLKLYKEYKVSLLEFNKAETNEAERERRIDILNYQISELESADLHIGEDQELNEQKKILQNKKRISFALNNAYEYLNGNEETDGALQLIEMSMDSLNDISDVMSEADNISQRIQNALYEIEDCREEISSLYDSSDSETGNIDEIEERLDQIRTLGRKYGASIEEMFDYLEKAKNELEYLNKYEENRENLKKKCEKLYKAVFSCAKKLSEKRKEVSQKFIEAVKDEMTFLDMPNVKLAVYQTECELNSFGCDNIEILISTNPGEAPKPVAKIASGGELSRMMLAIKNVLADKDNIDTLIFDEVDTGISGSAAQKVGLKLKEVSHSRQVLCVTHLAQIASLADNHFKIQKSVSDGKTFTNVIRLDYEGRKNELARIIGGVEITKATLDYAEEMLKKS